MRKSKLFAEFIEQNIFFTFIRYDCTIRLVLKMAAFSLELMRLYVYLISSPFLSSICCLTTK
jgi:hypothetical protein